MNIVVIGAQWGDEGKGKIVDYLAEDAKYVCRFAGGANAGHTIVVDGKKYALHQVPSGILYADKTVFLGSGMVVDPEALFKELEMLDENGINWEGRVFISDRAHIVLPCYRDIDKKRDSERKQPIGTTGRGIGTTYSQKSERDGIRLADLDWTDKMNSLDKADKDFLAPYIERLLAMRVDIASKMWEIRKENILFEGAQGAMLDLDSGTYPFVSSGASCSAGASSGAGIGPRAIDKIYGVFKAYETRVGNGPMPTEFNSETESELCDYEMDQIEACVAYQIGGKVVTDFPASIPALNNAVPVLKKFEGWKQPLKSITSYENLPSNAREYIEFIEDFTGTKVGIVSVGAERNQTFTREKIWTK